MAERESVLSGDARSVDTTAESVGNRLRGARRAGGRTLREVADEAEMSESFLSQLERGKASASISTLTRLSSALGLSMSALFEPRVSGARPLVASERPVLRFGENATKYLLTPSGSTQIEVFVARLEPGGSTGARPHAHGDVEELVLVLLGATRVQVGNETFELERGDSLTYRSSESHRVMNPHDDPAEVLWVIGLVTE